MTGKNQYEFPDYIEENGDWEFYRPILCQFVTSETVPDDAYGAEQVQDVFPHGDTYMPDTGMKAKNDEIISISRAEGLESRDIYLLISETDDLVKALES
ncbi:MAG: hypothetical protein ABEK04_04310 [Candidatus Nanohalobium sp.]